MLGREETAFASNGHREILLFTTVPLLFYFSSFFGQNSPCFFSFSSFFGQNTPFFFFFLFFLFLAPFYQNHNLVDNRWGGVKEVDLELSLIVRWLFNRAQKWSNSKFNFIIYQNIPCPPCCCCCPPPHLLLLPPPPPPRWYKIIPSPHTFKRM